MAILCGWCIVSTFSIGEVTTWCNWMPNLGGPPSHLGKRHQIPNRTFRLIRVARALQRHTVKLFLQDTPIREELWFTMYKRQQI
jgi:hypothetical protein